MVCGAYSWFEGMKLWTQVTLSYGRPVKRYFVGVEGKWSQFFKPFVHGCSEI